MVLSYKEFYVFWLNNSNSQPFNKLMKTLVNTIILGLLITIGWSCKDNNEPGPSEERIDSAKYILATMDENPLPDTYLGYINSKLTEITTSFGLTYTIEKISAPDAFTINTEGFVYINDTSVFDYEINPTVTAIVVVTGGGKTEKVGIAVTLNDTYEPVFMKLAVTGEGFPGRYGHEVIEFNGKVYVIGGYLGFDTGGFDSSVWVSPDMVNWTKQPVGATHFPPREKFATVVF
ncbi:MAG: kelch motif-containing protein, partial [Flavobacteriaceae bacterium]|nr:kelch motif-containing protein [Flavobacteriaceae bacterium]